MKAILTMKRLEALATAIADNFALCEFLGMTEAEVLVAQTVHAAYANAKRRGIQCSFRGDGVFSQGGNGIYDNGKGYRKLLDEKLIIEEQLLAKEFEPLPKGIKPDSDGKVPLIWLTDELVERLDRHLAQRAR